MKMEHVPIKQLFGLESKQTIERPVAQPQFAATEILNYKFRKDLMFQLLVFWRLGRRALMLTGHKGSGKTSLAEQFHLRMNTNLVQMTGNGKTNLEALFGQYVLVPDEQGTSRLVWQDGPVTMAARNGWTVLINEINVIPDDIQLALNDVAHEGSPFAIPEKGEQFMPAPGFRIVGTMNPTDGNSFMYRGRKEMDASFKERWFGIQVGYGSPEDEKEIVLNTWEAYGVPREVAEPLVDQMLAIATEVRNQANSTNAGAIPEIISTRVLVNWAIYWVMYMHVPAAVHKALQSALTNLCSAQVAYQIHMIVQTKTGTPSPLATSMV